jgi:programmed cell death protein 5
MDNIDPALQQQQQQEAQKQKEERAQQAVEQRNALLNQILEPAALLRLKRVGLVKPEKSKQIEDQLIRMYQQRQVTKVDEKQIIRMLEQVGAQEHTSTKVTIKRKLGDDSDDDFGGDDEDDDKDDYDSDDY